MSQETAVSRDIAKNKKSVISDYRNDEEEKDKLSQEEIQKLEDLYHRFGSHEPDEAEAFKKEHADFFKQKSASKENIYKLSFFMTKLDSQERKFFAEAIKKMPMTEDGFSAIRGIHQFEPVLILYDMLKKAGRANEDLY